jgi:probable phosphoglycerate mutase
MAELRTAICGLHKELVATFFVVRHAACDPVGHSIAGRAPGVHLNVEGRRQAAALAGRLGSTHIDAVYTSPLERARETIEPFARARDLQMIVAPAIIELDFGEWTGARLGELETDPVWKLFNSARSTTRIPGGETMREAQIRAVSFLQSIADQHPDSRNIVVSHGDIIRAVVMHFLEVPLDSVHHLEISAASISVVELYQNWAVVRAVNVSESVFG